MLLNWLRGSAQRAPKGDRSKVGRRTARPALEGLEDRLLLDSYTWARLGQDGDFGDAANWRNIQPFKPPAVPGPGDQAEIHPTVTVTSSQSRTVGVINVIGFGRLVIAGGTFTANYGGSIGNLTLNSGATFKAAGGTTQVSGNRSTSIAGTVLVGNGAKVIFMSTSDNSHTYTGTVQVAAGGRAEFAKGGGAALHPFASGSKITGAGTVAFIGGVSYIEGTYALEGTTVVAGGRVVFTSEARTKDATLSGGTLDGEGSFASSGTMVWSGTVLEGTGRITAEGRLNITGGGVKIMRREFINKGTATWTGTGNIRLDANFTNDTGAVFETKNDAVFEKEWVGVPPNRRLRVGPTSFINNGTFRKSRLGDAQPGRLTTAFAPCAFFNQEEDTGRVDVRSGTLRLSGSLLTSRIDVALLSVVEFGPGCADSWGWHTIRPSLTIAGDGLAKVTGTAYVEGSVSAVNFEVASGTLLLVNAGVLSVSRDYTQRSGAELIVFWPGQEAKLRVAGRASLAGKLSLVLGATPRPGDSFEVVSYGSVSGVFGRIEGLETTSWYFDPNYRANSLIVTVRPR